MSKNGGVIINISTTLPHCGVALQSHAGTAKAGVDALTRHLAVELGPKKIRVVGIAPGAIEKSEGFKRLRMDDSVIIYNLCSLALEKILKSSFHFRELVQMMTSHPGHSFLLPNVQVISQDKQSL